MEEVRGYLETEEGQGGRLERAGCPVLDGTMLSAPVSPGTKDSGQKPGQRTDQPKCLPLRLWGWRWWPPQITVDHLKRLHNTDGCPGKACPLIALAELLT